MPFKRIENGEVIKEVGTKQPTAKQLEEANKKEIKEQEKRRSELEKERKSAEPSPDTSVTGLSKTTSSKPGNRSS